MRDIKAQTKKVIVMDYMSGDKHTFYCRVPTLEERIDYRRKVLSGDEDKVKSLMYARIDGAIKIIEGFEKGTLSIDGKPISSDKDDADYFENWKEYLRDSCCDLLEAIAIKMFESGAEVLNENFFTRT